jgi:hypothetical protein
MDVLFYERLQFCLMGGIEVAINRSLQKPVVNRSEFGHNTNLISLDGGLSVAGHAK